MFQECARKTKDAHYLCFFIKVLVLFVSLSDETVDLGIVDTGEVISFWSASEEAVCVAVPTFRPCPNLVPKAAFRR